MFLCLWRVWASRRKLQWIERRTRFFLDEEKKQRSTRNSLIDIEIWIPQRYSKRLNDTFTNKIALGIQNEIGLDKQKKETRERRESESKE